jgi:transcription elongation GreA/GreB family factor
MKGPPMPAKEAVRDALLAAVRRALEAMVHSARETRAGAVHEENRSEGDKDMRATEQSYVARGQAMRVEDLADQVQRLETTVLRAFAPGDAIAPGALVRLRIDGEPRLFFVSLHGAGIELSVEGEKVTVVTPSSPVGAALVGRRRGEEFELPQRGTVREFEIDDVR